MLRGIGEKCCLRTVANAYNKAHGNSREYADNKKDTAELALNPIFQKANEAVLMEYIDTHLFTGSIIRELEDGLNFVSGTRRPLLLAGCFYHLQGAIPSHELNGRNILQYVKEVDSPQLEDNAHAPANRYVFFFLKQLHQLFNDHIDVAGTKAIDGVSWARGLAMAQPWDKNGDHEFSETELKELLTVMKDFGKLDSTDRCASGLICQ